MAGGGDQKAKVRAVDLRSEIRVAVDRGQPCFPLIFASCSRSFCRANLTIYLTLRMTRRTTCCWQTTLLLAAGVVCLRPNNVKRTSFASVSGCVYFEEADNLAQNFPFAISSFQPIHRQHATSSRVGLYL